MQKLYSIFVRIIRYTVNACLVIKKKHTTNRTEIANLESKVAFNFLLIIRYTVNVNLVIVSYNQNHESGIGTGTIHRELYARSKAMLSAKAQDRKRNPRSCRNEVSFTQNEERAGGRWQVRERVEGGEGGIQVGREEGRLRVEEGGIQVGDRKWDRWER